MSVPIHGVLNEAVRLDSVTTCCGKTVEALGEAAKGADTVLTNNPELVTCKEESC